VQELVAWTEVRNFFSSIFSPWQPRQSLLGINPPCFASERVVFVSGAAFGDSFCGADCVAASKNAGGSRRRITRMTRRVGRDFLGISLRGALKSRDMVTFSEGLNKGRLAFFDTA